MKIQKVARTLPVYTVFMIACANLGIASAQDLQITRLTWAGVKLVSGDTTVFIDAMSSDIWDGKAPGGLVDVKADTPRRYALITHTHNDHFDEAGLKDVLGERGYVICHESLAAHIASRGLRVIPARMWEPVVRGDFVFTAVPASDGFGAEQVSWIIKNNAKAIFHGGDTLWHGQFDLIGKQLGPFDVVFLPINGARMQTTTSTLSPGVLTPSQAIDAAALLGADLLVPIHFGLNDPPHYMEVTDPLESLTTQAVSRQQKIRHLKPGATLDWTE